jgi:hypothetical protein
MITNVDIGLWNRSGCLIGLSVHKLPLWKNNLISTQISRLYSKKFSFYYCFNKFNYQLVRLNILHVFNINPLKYNCDFFFFVTSLHGNQTVLLFYLWLSTCAASFIKINIIVTCLNYINNLANTYPKFKS